MAGPRDIELPLHKLQSGLDKRFPLNNRMLDLFDVELTRPQLAGLDCGSMSSGLRELRVWQEAVALAGDGAPDHRLNDV